ncbi:MAG: hypothetical protein EPN97_04300 [Alphaproteobacteria bacterium]|nr:MAG: hypothetical protein EPN97_04300 [Alphaproteobacteria bacterium]
MEIVVFKITGWTHGLLMNNPESMNMDEQDGKKKLAVKTHLTGQAEAETKVYKDEKGFLRFPAVAFRSAAVKGATGRKFGKVHASKAAKSFVFNAEQWVTIIDAKTGKPRKDWEVFTTGVVNPTTGGRTPRSRPLVKNWACLLPLEIDTELLSADNVLELLNQAGKAIGVGDFRPGCPRGIGGPYGRFSAQLAA